MPPVTTGTCALPAADLRFEGESAATPVIRAIRKLRSSLDFDVDFHSWFRFSFLAMLLAASLFADSCLWG